MKFYDCAQDTFDVLTQNSMLIFSGLLPILRTLRKADIGLHLGRSCRSAGSDTV